MDKRVAKTAEKYLKVCEKFAEVLHQLMKQDGLTQEGNLNISIGQSDLSFGTKEISLRYEQKHPAGEYFDNTMMYMYVSKKTDSPDSDGIKVGWNNMNSSVVNALLEDES